MIKPDAPDGKSFLLDRALAASSLTAVLQPVIRIASGEIVAYEGLIRSTLSEADLTPTDLLDLARARGRLGEFELRAAHCVAGHFVEKRSSGRLLVNLSSYAILQDGLRSEDVIEALSVPGLDLGRVTVEITERDIPENTAQLAHTLGYLRARGVRIALDDFGNGHSNFEMWNEVHPDIVKIDRYLINGLSRSAEKLAIVRALCSVAEMLGAELVGEGVEEEADLQMLSELGISFAQGFLIARPSADLVTTVSPRAIAALSLANVPVLPRPRGPVSARPFNAEHMRIDAPFLSPLDISGDLIQVFADDVRLHAVAIVDNGRPAGIINRRRPSAWRHRRRRSARI